MTAFPLAPSLNGRYLVDANGRPWRSQHEQLWLSAASFTPSDFQSQIDNIVAQKINAITLMAVNHDYEEDTGKLPYGSGPAAYNGVFPFGLQAAGGAYTGTGITSAPNGSVTLTVTPADVSSTSTQNAYWSVIDAALTYCLSKGVLVYFPAGYLGYQGKIEGLAADLAASGPTKCAAFGTFLGNRYKSFGNIIWIIGGDFDPTFWDSGEGGSGPYPGLTSCVEHMFSAIRAAGATQLMGGHFPFADGLPTDISAVSATLAALVGVNTIYSYQTTIEAAYQTPADAWAVSPPVPAILYDPGDLYENDGITLVNFRAQSWYGAIGAVGGQGFGNDPDWFGGLGSSYAAINTTSGLQSPGHGYQRVLQNVFANIQWQLLVPAGSGGMRTLVTANQGTNGGLNWILAAADFAGALLIAYVPDSHAGAFTVDISFLRKPVAAQWVDPTNGNVTPIASQLTGASHSFTVPGANGAGNDDWVLLLTNTGDFFMASINS